MVPKMDFYQEPHHRRHHPQPQQHELHGSSSRKKALASDALPLPIPVTNAIFMASFFLASYFLIGRWREKVRLSIPLHMLTAWEMVAILALVSSFIYLLGFFGIDYVQGCLSRSDDDSSNRSDSDEDTKVEPRPEEGRQRPPPTPVVLLQGRPLGENTDDDIVGAVVSGQVSRRDLEDVLGDCHRAARIRHRAVEATSGRSLDGLPLDHFDYDAVLGSCCESVIGYVQIPVGAAGPLKIDGVEYFVPMATTEGCLIASTNRGCKAINLSGGAVSVVVKDGITRAPVVGFSSVKEAAELKFYMEDPKNFDELATIFNGSSRFGRLQKVVCTLAGRNVYMRFSCATGDAMGMNMISKCVQSVLDHLVDVFPEMRVLSVSGNLCADKKPTAVNWIEGRGKSVVCEAVIKGEVISTVFKTSVTTLVELNTLKNLAGSALAGAIGGFNAHASNIVTAVFIATGQDPAQNVESSQCLTLMEAVNDGKDLHISVTMPSIEVGTMGGGTQLPSQAACLNLLGVKGCIPEKPGFNARKLSTIVAGAVLAGELSLMAALVKGQLVKSHMKYNRSSRNIAAVAAAAEQKEQQQRKNQQLCS